MKSCLLRLAYGILLGLSLFCSQVQAAQVPLAELAQDFHPYDYLHMSAAEGRLNMGTMFHLRALRRQDWQSDTGPDRFTQAGFARAVEHLQFQLQVRFDQIHSRHSRVTLGLAHGNRLQVEQRPSGIRANLGASNSLALSIDLIPGRGVVRLQRRDQPAQEVRLPRLAALAEEGAAAEFIDVTLWRLQGQVELWIDGTRIGTWPDAQPTVKVIPFIEFSRCQVTFRRVAIQGLLAEAPSAAWQQRQDEEHLLWRLSEMSHVMITDPGVRSHAEVMTSLSQLADYMMDMIAAHDRPCPRVLAYIAVNHVYQGRSEDGRRAYELSRQALADGNETYFRTREARVLEIERLLGVLGESEFAVRLRRAEVAGVDERFWGGNERRLRQRTTRFDGNDEHQFHEEFHRNGNLQAQGFRRSRPRVGPWWQYHQSGRLEAVQTLVFDGENGPTRQYYPSGHLRARGSMIAYHRHFPRRFGLWEEYYDHEEPRLRLRGHYVGGRREGEWEAFYPNGIVAIRARYAAGELSDDPECFDREGLSLSPLVLAVAPDLNDFQGQDLGALTEHVGADEF
ncbi:MAG: hypothetical protein EA402_10445 [Planctomycetota bacterium]|nr:MAG: hypothetical protein EA402_10445 [Planctomycetota bacterium]